ncbi:MAG: hypothetical protein ABSB89_05685 [Candidatus Bathyarchaeia archaeon]|jgi:hypothetical protein
MPANSIDTFFACALIVSAVFASIALLSGTLTAQTNSVQDSNQAEYFRAVSESILWDVGNPANWGSVGNEVPQSFGLAKESSVLTDELDIDKISRLNPQNSFSLTYPNILEAAGLTSALGLSASQLLDISVNLSANTTTGDVTEYTFNFFVSQQGIPVETILHCYVVARDFDADAYANTSTDGLGSVNFELPNASNGTALLVTFARAIADPRITAYQTYRFQHLSSENQSDNTFLTLTPLNYTLYIAQNQPDISIQNSLAFSYGYQINLTAISNSTYTIPTISDSSPIVLVTRGSNSSTFFIEWTSYPEIPFYTGADFQNSEVQEFTYLVSVNGFLCRFTFQFGGLNP